MTWRVIYRIHADQVDLFTHIYKYVKVFSFFTRKRNLIYNLSTIFFFFIVPHIKRGYEGEGRKSLSTVYAVSWLGD